MDSFQVGEVAIFVRPGSARYGTEVEIIAGLQFREGHDDRDGSPMSGVCYMVLNVDGDKRCVFPEWLRKKRPPEEYDGNRTVSWDDCPWKPEVVTV